MTEEYEPIRNNECSDVLRDNLHGLLQRIKAKIEAKQKEPQELWSSLRCFMLEDKVFVPPGLLRNVLEFCLTVYDAMEPKAPFDERQKRIALPEAFVLLINPRMGRVVKGLSASFGIGLAMANGEE